MAVRESKFNPFVLLLQLLLLVAMAWALMRLWYLNGLMEGRLKRLDRIEEFRFPEEVGSPRFAPLVPSDPGPCEPDPEDACDCSEYDMM